MSQRALSIGARAALETLTHGIKCVEQFDGRNLRSLTRLGFIKRAKKAGGNYVEITKTGRTFLKGGGKK